MQFKFFLSTCTQPLYSGDSANRGEPKAFRNEITKITTYCANGNKTMQLNFAGSLKADGQVMYDSKEEQCGHILHNNYRGRYVIYFSREIVCAGGRMDGTGNGGAATGNAKEHYDGRVCVLINNNGTITNRKTNGLA